MPKARSERCDILLQNEELLKSSLPENLNTVWSLIKNGLIKVIHFLMRLRPKQSIEMPKQSIEICLVNT